MRLAKLVGLGVLLVVSSACMDLDTTNPNAPDVDRALTDAGDVEALLGTGYFLWMRGTGIDASMHPLVGATETTSAWGNWGLRDAAKLPREPYDNSIGARRPHANSVPWSQLYEALSNVADALHAVEYRGLRFEGTNQDNTDRGRAFGKFVQGLAHGWLALHFDQAPIFDEHVLENLDNQVPEPRPYAEVMEAAIGYFEEAIEIAETADPFQLPENWIRGRPLTNAELIQWSHSYLSNYLPAVARTPTERAQVDWNQVLYHLDRGVQEMDGPIPGQQDQIRWWWRTGTLNPTFLRVPYDLIGPTDNSGNYEEWLASDPRDREMIGVHTDDRRVTGPDGPEDDGKYIRFVDWQHPFPVDRGAHKQSVYFHHRFRDVFRPSNYQTMMPAFNPDRKNLRRAEALLRLGQNRNQAVDLVNETRVKNGELEPLPYSISDQALWGWWMYEFALETAGLFFWTTLYDRRGLGTLICGTPIHYPIPSGELELMDRPIYTFGGSGEGGANPADGCRGPKEPATNVILR